METGREATEQGEEMARDDATENEVVDEVALARALALRAHPDAVPELVTGATVAEIVASLEPARAAYRRIAERVGGREVVAPAIPNVPAGSAPPVAIDPDRLPAAEKIRRGLARRR